MSPWKAPKKNQTVKCTEMISWKLRWETWYLFSTVYSSFSHFFGQPFHSIYYLNFYSSLEWTFWLLWFRNAFVTHLSHDSDGVYILHCGVNWIYKAMQCFSCMAHHMDMQHQKQERSHIRAHVYAILKRTEIKFFFPPSNDILWKVWCITYERR